MSRPEEPAHAKPWHRESTAEAYDRYARQFPTYQVTSTDLVAAVGIGPGERVVDLGCGTGLTTQAILRQVGTDGRVFAVDSSAAMLATARRNITAGNVSWLEGRAEDVAALVAAPVDHVVSNMSFWHFDTRTTTAAAAAILAPHGRLAFSDAHRGSTEGPGHDREDRWRHRLEVCGYIVDDIQHRTYPESRESLLSWMQIPLWTGGGEPDRATAKPAGAEELLTDGQWLLHVSYYICRPA